MKKERKKETLKIMKAAGIAGIAGVGIAAGGLMSANSVYAATEKQANTDTAVSRDQVTVKDQTAESTDESKSVEANASENVSKNADESAAKTGAETKTDETLKSDSANEDAEAKDASAAKNTETENTKAENTEEKAETTSEKTGEKVAVVDGVTTKTETYTHHKITTSQHDEEPTEEEKKNNLSADGREPYVKHVKETTDESWEETKTTETKTVKTEVGKKMTNEDDYSSKKVYVIDNSGKTSKATETQEQSVKNFYDSQNVTSDFAVYAKSLDGTIGHEDGNIAVKNLNQSTTIMNKDGQYAGNRNSGVSQHDVDQAYAENGYSYIGKTRDSDYITSSSNFSKNGKNASLVIYGTDEGNSSEDTDGSANHFMSVHLKDGSVPAEYQERTKNLNSVVKFDENLKNMADAGQKAIDFSQNSLSDIENLRAANETIQAGTLGNGDILSLSLSSNILKNDWTAGDFNEINNLLTGLINGNTNHVNILVNVKIRASDLSGDELKNLNAMMNGVNNYDCRASYLTWNFGNFDGTISMFNTMSGNFIAPNATLNVGGLESGRAVSSSFSHNGEIHMAVKGTTSTQYSTGTETSVKTSEGKHTTKTTSSASYDYKDAEKPKDSTDKPSTPKDDTTKPKDDTEKPKDSTNKPDTPKNDEEKPKDNTEKPKGNEEKPKDDMPKNDAEKPKGSTDTPKDSTDTPKNDTSVPETPNANETKPDVPHDSTSKNKLEVQNGGASRSKYENSQTAENAGAKMTHESGDHSVTKGKAEKKPETETSSASVASHKNTESGNTVQHATENGTASGKENYASDGAPQTGDATSVIGSVATLISSGGLLAFLAKKMHRSKLEKNR